MQLTGRRLRLSRDTGPNPWRLLFLVALITAGLVVFFLRETGRIQPLFLPAPTPTRTGSSYAEEGRTQFQAGNLNAAIEAYQEAVRVEPGNARLWAEMARIQTYSSALLTNAGARRARLAQARDAIDQAVLVAPDDGFVQAIRALVYDWSAAAEDLNDPENLRDDYLAEAKASAVRALGISPGDPLALAFHAEVLLDEQSFQQALNLSRQAVEALAQAGPDYAYAMDVHRVQGTVLEGYGYYGDAILEYLAALETAPNFTFLYLAIGVNYRQVRDIDKALEYFAAAARINEQLHILDPTPYLAIGRTYLQQGEFFIASRNMERALAISSGTADIYGRLGIVFFKARNYESAVRVLACAVEGCTTEESRAILCEFVHFCDPESEEAQQYGAEVPALELRDDTLEYFYTYGAVLAYFRDTAEVPEACTRAERVFQALMAVYGEDAIVAGIVDESRGLCSGQAATAPTVTPTPGATAGS